jgi:DNA anti-recombination protein RmuC
MSENVLETIRATVQDFLAPELRTHGVRLDNIERRLDDTRHSLEQRMDDLKSSLEHRILDSKETLRAEMRVLEARMDARLDSIENLLRNLIQQISIESNLRERVASLEARMPKQ